MEEVKNKSNWFLYLTAISANLMALVAGCNFAWTSPVLPRLHSTDPSVNPLDHPIGPIEESLISSLINVSSAIVPFFAGYAADKIGRKKTLLFFSSSMFATHVILAFSTKVEFFYVARILVGIGCGSALSVVPLYVAEIAENTNRGLLGCFMELFITVGELFCLLIGLFFPFKLMSFMLLIPAIIFVVMFAFLPESPYYLLLRGDTDGARVSLRKLRTTSDSILDKELEEMKYNVQMSLEKKSTLKDLMQSRSLMKALLVCVGLMFFQQMSGITPILNNLEPIFIASGIEKIAPEMAAIIISVIQVIFCFITSMVVERFGKKKLLVLSLFGTATSLTILGLYFFLKDNEIYDVQRHLHYLPLACLIAYMISFVLALGPICWAIMGELFPPEAKSVAAPLVTFTCTSLGFCTSGLFPYLILIFGMGETLWFFAVGTLVGIFFVVFYVPETTGKSLLEIQLFFEGVKQAPGVSVTSPKNTVTEK